jgi:hypothetical protein
MYDREFLVDLLKTGRILVCFNKKDGSDRQMVCTLKADLIPADSTGVKTKHVQNQNQNIIRVYDLESRGWRSFNIDSVYLVDIPAPVEEDKDLEWKQDLARSIYLAGKPVDMIQDLHGITGFPISECRYIVAHVNNMLVEDDNIGNYTLMDDGVDDTGNGPYTFNYHNDLLIELYEMIQVMAGVKDKA